MNKFTKHRSKNLPVLMCLCILILRLNSDIEGTSTVIVPTELFLPIIYLKYLKTSLGKPSLTTLESVSCILDWLTGL